MNKYGARKTKVDNLTFDSRMEAARYQELKLLAAAGAIADLQVHPQFELQAAFRTPDGERISAIRHKPDFQYIENGQTVVEDVKGRETTDWRLRYRLFRKVYPEIMYKVVKP
jgi:hypothetical protein